MCYTTNGKKCFLKGIPVFSTGIDMPSHSVHIVTSILFGGFTRSQGGSGALPFVLVRTPGRNAVLNRGSKWPCKGITGAGRGLSCDEYPYASTGQGGEVNWQADMVSLMPVPSWESAYQGGRLSGFYRGARVDAGTIFVNIAVPMFPTFYIDRGGIVHR